MPGRRDVNVTAGEASLLFLFQIRLEIFFAAADRGHETDAVALRYRAGPAFQLDETPVGKIVDLALLVRLGRKEEELHPLFLYPDLSYPAHFVVVENARAEGLEFGELRRHIVMLQPVLHKK